MTQNWRYLCCAFCITVPGSLAGQPAAPPATNTVEAHVEAARAAAAQDHPGLFQLLCSPGALHPANPATPPPRPDSPPRSSWHAEPVKVFDNLYFFGQTEFSAWAVTTSAGIIVIDTIFDYSVQDEIVDGMKKMGLDPKTIQYAIVSHGHFDHSGGARFLQEHFGTRVLMSEADWGLLDRNTTDPAKPKRDMVVTDGMKLTLGAETLRLYLTPGHTPGTISTLIPVTDRGTPHLAAAWGGTAFNFPRSPEAFQTYIDSARRFRDIVTAAGADVIIANHTNFDESKTKLPAVLKRGANDPNPFVIGRAAVTGYMTVATECATAAKLSLMTEVPR